MAVPKKRRSYSKNHMRKAHHALRKVNHIACANCQEPTLPHRVCPNCGMYKGKRIRPIED